ncbi:MAG: hypothetical protein HOC20_00965 [Chloroflexi bacterium]|jgi:hypothetical protein|nr:hypothetical protein [Chloroflexota bacterium]
MKRIAIRITKAITLLVIAMSICLTLVSCGGSASTPTATPISESSTSPEYEVSSQLVTPTPLMDKEIIEVQTAEFEVTTLTANPDTLTVGETTDISVDITNISEIEGTYTATLTIDNDQLESKDIVVGAGDTQQVSFTYSPVSAGTYNLELGELTTSLNALEPTLSGPAEVTITRNQTTTDFPDTIGFTLEGTSVLSVTKISLEYGTSKRSLVSEVSRVEPDYAIGNKIKASWIWQMKETGSLPPGTSIWWRWRITDVNDRLYTTPRQTMLFEDTRFNWKVESREDMDLYYHDRDSSFGQELTDGIEEKLTRIELDVDIPEDRKIQIFVYADTDEFQSAVLFLQEWTGGVAFTQYNIIVYGIRPDQLDWGKRTLAHEITHILVEEATFGPFGDLPTWLNEGLAEYAEGEMSEHYKDVLATAIINDELISVTSLCSGFPANPDKATLAYTQSSSLVTYLVETYGWEKMRGLLEIFKDGSTYDNALEEVYSFNIKGLEDEWKAYIGAI